MSAGGWPSFFFPYRNSHMGEPKKRSKPPAKVESGEKKGTKVSGGTPSGVPSSGGSRQGNAGHESTGQSDNSHR